MPLRCVIIYLKYRIVISVTLYYGNSWYRGSVKHISVGLMHCSFRQTGQCEASEREASESIGLHAFFVCLNELTKSA